MSLDELMNTLQMATAKSKLRSEENTNAIQQQMQAMASAQTEGARAPGGARGRVGSGNDAGPLNFSGLGKIVKPIKGITISSNYGPRTHPITGRQSNHTGVDLSAPGGTPILAVANGRVKQSNANDSIYGNQVILGHGKGYSTMYGHMSKFIVRPGDRVRRGQVIGYVGSTGMSTGNHLHWETWYRGDPTDPMKFL